MYIQILFGNTQCLIFIVLTLRDHVIVGTGLPDPLQERVTWSPLEIVRWLLSLRTLGGTETQKQCIFSLNVDDGSKRETMMMNEYVQCLDTLYPKKSTKSVFRKNGKKSPFWVDNGDPSGTNNFGTVNRIGLAITQTPTNLCHLKSLRNNLA